MRPTLRLAEQSFNRGSLSRCLTHNDFFSTPKLRAEAYRHSILDEAVDLSEKADQFSPALTQHVANGRQTYSIQHLPSKLVARRCAQNLRGVQHTPSRQRNQIINCLREMLSDGTQYRIYRLDIRSFFESCKPDQALRAASDLGASVQTTRLAFSLLSTFSSAGGQGLPRGVEISPPLAEAYLAQFDECLLHMPHTLYYERFVDDILIVTSRLENQAAFMQEVTGSLPSGLTLSTQKQAVLDVPSGCPGTSTKQPVGSFDFLGYRISVMPHDSKNAARAEMREIRIDLSKRKFRRLQERVFKSFYAFRKNGDFELLRDRLIFLSTNRNLLDKSRDRHGGKPRTIPTGSYYNYTAISQPSARLSQLDQMIRRSARSPAGKLAPAPGKHTLTTKQRRAIERISFVRGHQERVFHRFNPHRLKEIARIWKW